MLCTFTEPQNFFGNFDRTVTATLCSAAYLQIDAFSVLKNIIHDLFRRILSSLASNAQCISLLAASIPLGEINCEN